MAKTKKKDFWQHLALFFAIFGPGFITGSVDNDVGGITTYSVAGATYGYQLLWTLIPAAVALFVVQEMNARMGVVTGKGLADLIRENAGVKATCIIFLFLLGADVMNTTTEFAGVAGSMQIFGVSKYISVPIAALLVWLLIVKGTYKQAEKVFIVFGLCLFVYVISAIMAKPDWTAVGKAITHPSMNTDSASVSMVIGLIGTTIAPWMQFYMQSSVIEKGITIKHYKYTILDVLTGVIATVVVAFFIMLACASTLYVDGHGTVINDASDAARALEPLAGPLAGQVFGFGLLVAAVFSAVILPVACSFYICEAFGFEAGIDKKWEDAPQFYWLYTIILILSAGIILLPNAPLIGISLWSQRIDGILLPVVLICMMVIINKKEVMGKHTNSVFQNIIGWATIGVLVVLSGMLVISSL